MVDIQVNLENFSIDRLQNYIRQKIAECEIDAIVRVKIEGKPDPEKLKLISAKFLREIAPSTMNIDFSIPFYSRFSNAGK